MRVLDLFAGLGGFSQAFKNRGHIVTTVDIDSEFGSTYTMDVRDFNIIDEWDVVLASPPCQEFSKSSMPESWPSVRKYGCHPSVELLGAALRIILRVRPRYWVVENVRGAVKFFRPILGEPKKVVGSRYLWGDFPIFDCLPKYGKWRIPPSKNRAAIRSLIPYPISLGLCKGMELWT